MPRSKRILGTIGAICTALLIGLWGPALYAQARMATTTGVVYVRGIIGSLPITVAGLITTSTDGLVLQNTTAATVGVPVQISPRLLLSGQGWDTDDVTTRPVRFGLQVLPTGTTTVAGTLEFIYLDPITSAITKPLVLTSVGALTTTAGITALGALTAAFPGGGGFVINNSTADAGVTNGSYLSFQTAGSNRYYMGMSANGNTGNFDLYNNIASAISWSVAKTTNIMTVNHLGVGAALTWDSTAPGISGFAGSGPAATVTAGSTTAAFRIGVGGTAPGTTGTITLPTATTGWNCWVVDQTTPLDITRQTSSTTATVVITSTIAWTANDILVGGCAAF